MREWYAVIGSPIEHSKSPYMHSKWFDELKIDATYIPIHVPVDHLKEAVESLYRLGCSGFNVTVPLKEEIISYLQEIDDYAKVVGAVNTVIRTEKGWKGYNTDGIGFVHAFEEQFGTDLKGSKGLIIGAGGAARGIIYAMRESGYSSLSIVNRTFEKAKVLEDLFQLEKVVRWKDLSVELSNYDFIIQTTSIGLTTNDSWEMTFSHMKDSAVVCDIIYNPWKTSFLQQAEDQGMAVQNGLGMFVQQGAESFSLWTGTKPSTHNAMVTLTSLLGGTHVNR